MKKWSKKVKLKVVCYKLMCSVIANANIGIMLDNSNEMQSLLVAALRV